MDWKQELLKRLDALADKLGTTGQHLWQVLVKQAYVEGVAALVMCGVFVAVIAVLVKLFPFLQQKSADAGYDNEGWVVLMVFDVMACIGSAITSIVCLHNGLLLLLNPEYGALEKILSTIASR